jgi:branched-chain amino acid transport system substrate-binding protein
VSWFVPRSAVVAAALAIATLGAGASAAPAQEAIRLGELNSYNRMAAFTVPYRNGWQMALDEVNAQGGVLGRKLEIVSRDDGGTTGDAVRIAEELLVREKAVLLFGTFLSNVGLAVGDFAAQKKVLFFASEPLADELTLDKGNRYTFCMRPNTYMQTAMLVEKAKGLGVKRWAIVAPNYAYGQSAADNFKALIPSAEPKAEIIAEQYPALGKIDAGSTVSALAQANAQGLFNVLFGPDLAQFVREGNVRGLFEGKTVLSLLTGEPEWLLGLKDEAPKGWIATGYPWDEIEAPAHKAFVAKYRARFNETPRLGSLLGYTMVQAIRAMLERARSTDTEAMVRALEGLAFEAPFGKVVVRASDHQATMGAWVGRIAVKDGLGTLTDWSYADGADYMVSEAEVARRRPK